MRFRRFVAANKDGSYRFEFPEPLKMLVVQLATELNESLDDDNPDLARLFPTAYAKDPDLDAGYQILARGELVDHRNTLFDTVKASATLDVLDDEQLSAWMGVVNDLRLVLGTKLDVSEDDHSINEDHPDARAYEIYMLLGHMLSEIVDGLSANLPDEGTGERPPPGIDLA